MYDRMQMCSSNSAWKEIAPWLDDAMATVSDTDRHAIVLRFFENKNLSDVGETLGISDDTAHKRISRALERLRSYLGKRKKAVTVITLSALIANHAVQAAPAQLVD